MSDPLPPAPDAATELDEPAEYDLADRLLVVRAATTDEADALASAAAALAKRRGKAVMVIVGDTRLEALDDEAMLRAGWVRVEALEALAPSADPAQLARVIEP